MREHAILPTSVHIDDGHIDDGHVSVTVRGAPFVTAYESQDRRTMVSMFEIGSFCEAKMRFPVLRARTFRTACSQMRHPRYEEFGSASDLAVMTPAVSGVRHARPAYDHRLREHVVRRGPLAVAKHVHVPRPTVSTWRQGGLRPVVAADPFDQDTQVALDSSARWGEHARVLAAVGEQRRPAISPTARRVRGRVLANSPATK